MTEKIVKKVAKKTVKKSTKKTIKKVKKIKKVFLGGTWNNSLWREELIPQLTIDYFNPVKKDWTAECQAEEKRQREVCDYCLYVITPKMSGLYSIAEVIDDSNKRPKKTIFCWLERDEHLIFNKKIIKSLEAITTMVEENGGKSFTNLRDVAKYLNK